MADMAQTPEQPDHAASAPRIDDRREVVRVRRAPKISVFLLAGAAVGIVVALILTYAFQGSLDVSRYTGIVYSQGQVFGFLVLGCIPIGIVLGALVALILDRRSRKRIHDVTIDHESVRED
ncbi:potassium transporter Trk [Microbacterium sp. NPDC055910]|uniref:potassium transporter Trk n=1 Tax=Microbacterium sp. NPDC055910 TaxID=3345659 RepID=UPI0035D5C53D